ncbi:MAG TPA: hypothetical protein VK601_26570 [Kofleriaceae bacterium]|nr:hypothetical protein [Kofleriaceae bacterium]
MADSLKLAGQQLSQLAPLEPEAAALEFERRMWQKWLDRYAFRLVKHTETKYPTLTDPMGPSAQKIETSYGVKERTPDKIKNRCARIGLDYAKYAGGIKQRYEAEAARRTKAIADYKDDPYGDDDD